MVEQPRIEHISPWLHVASIVAAQADVANMMYAKDHGFVEYNPIAAPMVNLPNPAYEVTAMGSAIALNLLADRMNRSRRFHKFARPLLALQIGGNVYGLTSTVARGH